jgi:hypothetical protein
MKNMYSGLGSGWEAGFWEGVSLMLLEAGVLRFM